MEEDVLPFHDSFHPLRDALWGEWKLTVAPLPLGIQLLDLAARGFIARPLE